MRGQKRSGRRIKVLYDAQKRGLAFLLAAVMILTNVGAGTNTAYAADSSDSVVFTMEGTQLLKAVEEAIFSKNEVAADEFDFTNGKIDEFETLFNESGKIYEAFPELDGGNLDAELRIFVRLPENADETYIITGDEDIIFLYVNNGDETISCTTEIIRMVDGEEKVKKISPIKVKSYEAAFGDEEIDIISKPVEETIAPTEDESQKETSAAIDEETTIVPDNDETTIVPETTTAPEESATTEPPEESATEEPSQTEASEEKSQEANEPEETDAPETEAKEVEAAAEPVASIIRHFAPVVADSEEDVTEAPKAKDETEALVPETEAPVETETTTEAEPAETTTATEESSSDGTTTADGGIVESENDETTVPREESSTESNESSSDVPETAAPLPTEETAKVPTTEDNVNKVEAHDLVGIGYCSTAKAYMTSLNKLKVMDDKVVISTMADDGAEITVSGYSQAMENIAFVSAECLDDVDGFIEQINAELAPSGQTIDKIAVYDVTVIDNDGNETQPSDEVKVTIKAPEIVSNDGNVGAFHAKELAEDGQEYEIEIKDVVLNEEQGTITMGTDSFSPVGAYSLTSASDSGTAYKSWEDSSWKTEPIILEPTSEGINISYEQIGNSRDKAAVLRVEIGENVDAGKLNINMGSIVNDTLNIVNFIPSDSAKLKLEIINNSSYDYKYVNNSLAFTIIPEGDDSGYRSFTGQIIPKGNTEVWRTGNSALRALYGWGDRANDWISAEVIDAKLGQKLLENKYSNGIADLSKYYLDYYNEKYELNANQLDELPDEVIAYIFGYGNFYNAPFNNIGGKRPDGSDTIRETVREVTELGYNYFYNSILTLYTSDYTGNEDADPATYSLGSYMRSYNNNGSTVMEPYFSGSFSDIPAGEDIVMDNQIIMHMHGGHATNAYQVQAFDFTFGFQLEKPSQNPTPDPTIPDGGGSGGGGGGGNTPNGRRATPETNGPGITIEPEAVPLAPLPETILDGEVPLAPLPKTGQGLGMPTLTMMISGILLAIAAIGRKRKEF